MQKGNSLRRMTEYAPLENRERPHSLFNAADQILADHATGGAQDVCKMSGLGTSYRIVDNSLLSKANLPLRFLKAHGGFRKQDTWGGERNLNLVSIPAISNLEASIPSYPKVAAFSYTPLKLLAARV